MLWFLRAKKHLHKWVCLSVRPPVRPLRLFNMAVSTCCLALRDQYLPLFFFLINENGCCGLIASALFATP